MSMAMKYAVQKRNRMAKGGDVRNGTTGYEAGVNTPLRKNDPPGRSYAGSYARQGQATDDVNHQSGTQTAKEIQQQTLTELRGMRGQDRQNLAEGGEACQACRGGTCMAHGGDVVDRVMKRMSEGGMIANGGDTNDADQEPAQFDDLALRDDLESSYTGANSGDMDGPPEGLSDDEDMIERIMKRLRG